MRVKIEKYYEYCKSTQQCEYSTDAFYMRRDIVFTESNPFPDFEVLDFISELGQQVYVERTADCVQVHNEIPKHWILRILSAVGR